MSKTVTMKMWEAAGRFEDAAEPGDLIEDEIIAEFCDGIPPIVRTDNLIQAAEPYGREYDTEQERWRPTYFTFYKQDGRWTYAGCCFFGSIERRGGERT